jgi:carboxyl-terminal processing protease
MMRSGIKLTLLFALTAALVSRGDEPPKPPIEPAAAEVLEEHIAAIGGRAAWEAVRTTQEQTEVDVLGMKRTTTHIEDRATGRYKTVTISTDGVTETGFDGTRAWQKAPFFRGYFEDNDPRARAAKRRPPRLIDYRDGTRPFRRLPNETIDAKTYVVLESEDIDHVGRPVTMKYFFDPLSCDLLRVTRGSALAVTSVFDDYRTVDGVRVAFKRTSINPQVTLVTSVTEWKSNVPVTDAMFAFDGDGASGANAPAPSAAPLVPTSAPTLGIIGPKDEIPEQLRLDTFDVVWRTINDSYWDPTFGGIDWKAIRDQYLPRVKAAKLSDEFHRVLDEMIRRLGQSHFAVIRPDHVVGIHTRSDRDLENGSVGLTLRWIDGEAVVYDLERDFPARAAGVRKGWVLLRMNGKTPQALYEKSLRERPGFHLRPEISRIRALSDELGGKPGEKVTLDFLDERNRARRVVLTRKAQSIGESTDVEFESKRIGERVGYVRFSLFYGDLISRFDAALRSLRDTDSLIIDLRGNPGGAGDLAPAVASAFAATPGSLGTSKFRYATRDFAYKAAADPYRGRVYILVDEWSASTSEVFTSGMQESKRATVIGTATAGAVLPSLLAFLPTGAALQYVISDFRTPAGRLVEGSGVTPDIDARLTRAALLQGKDPALEAALALAAKEYVR